MAKYIIELTDSELRVVLTAVELRAAELHDQMILDNKTGRSGSAKGIKAEWDLLESASLSLRERKTTAV